MIDSFQPYLQNLKILILDGAMATELERYGANINDPLWSAKVLIENPELIRQVHLDYLRAGADIITTASYQATFEGFNRRRINHQDAAELMRLSAKLAQEARHELLQNLQSKIHWWRHRSVRMEPFWQTGRNTEATMD